MIKLFTEYKIDMLDSTVVLVNPMVGMPVVAETMLKEIGIVDIKREELEKLVAWINHSILGTYKASVVQYAQRLEPQKAGIEIATGKLPEVEK
jgi:hypothetical protein